MEARARGLQIDLEVADVRTVRKVVVGHFDAVISCDNALSHLLTEADLDEAIDNVRACLRGGGLLIASVRDYDALAIARPTGIPIALHGPSGERQGAGQAWVWSPAGDQLQIALFTLAEGPKGVWNAAAHETTLRALRRSELTAALAQHGFEAVHWLMPEESGYYQPIVVAVAESQT
jgi:glycine/sarcosine N-methyltransferase